jgi:hypothetical protein
MPRKFFLIAASLVSSKQAISMLVVMSSKSSTNTTMLIVTERGRSHHLSFLFLFGVVLWRAYTVPGEAQSCGEHKIQRYVILAITVFLM